MPKQTKQDYFTALVLKEGWEQSTKTWGKYRTFSHPEKLYKIFLGKNGAIRVGRTQANSRSWTDREDTFVRALANGSISPNKVLPSKPVFPEQLCKHSSMTIEPNWCNEKTLYFEGTCDDCGTKFLMATAREHLPVRSQA